MAARQTSDWSAKAKDIVLDMWREGSSSSEIIPYLQRHSNREVTRSVVLGIIHRERKKAGTGAPARAPKRQPAYIARNAVTAEHRRFLQTRWDSGATNAAIINGFRHRFGITIGVDTLREICRKPEPRKVVIQRPSAGPSPLKPKPRPPRIRPGDTGPESLRILIEDARHDQCRFIAGDPLVDRTCCGHATVSLSWCAYHHRVVTGR